MCRINVANWMDKCKSRSEQKKMFINFACIIRWRIIRRKQSNANQKIVILCDHLAIDRTLYSSINERKKLSRGSLFCVLSMIKPVFQCMWITMLIDDRCESCGKNNISEYIFLSTNKVQSTTPFSCNTSFAHKIRENFVIPGKLSIRSIVQFGYLIIIEVASRAKRLI